MALRSQGNWWWEGPLGTPLGWVHWKRASSPVEAGTAGYGGILVPGSILVTLILWQAQKKNKAFSLGFFQDSVHFELGILQST